ncbi:MAG: sulfatase-like hydrolase/transferase [Planctomycetes bacterium]|nr:sulfatase-like hydrolase/transferase [Planctomycetota bacterium]
MADKRISRRWFLLAAAFLMLLCSVGCSVGRSVGRDVRYKVSAVVGNYGFPRKPNVILVVSDGQGYGDMACHGNGVVKTPNIDRFYKQSSRFGKFFVSPFGQSTQASVLTGRNVPVSGELLKEDVSLAEVLGRAGYKTCTDVFFDEAIGFIEENRDGPFFCYISVSADDRLNEVDEKYSAPYRKQGFSEDVANFYGSITNLDENFGRLLSRVKGYGLLGNTLIIFMTGSGSAMGDREGVFNAGFRGGKGSVYEGGARAASFWRMPGTIKPNRTIEQMAMHYDIVPTLMSICDAEYPEPEKLEGINLIPYLMNLKQKEKDRSFVTLGKNGDYSVRTSRFRLVNGSELYDVNANTSETINVIARYPAEVAQIRAVYDR